VRKTIVNLNYDIYVQNPGSTVPDVHIDKLRCADWIRNITTWFR